MSDSRYFERPGHPGRFRCCGVLIDGLASEAATQALLTSRHGHARSIHLCDSYTLSVAMRDREFRDLLNRADLNLAAGSHLVNLGRKRGHRNLTTRIHATNLMLDTLSQGRQQGLKHFLYGDSRYTVDALKYALEKKLPGVNITGTDVFTRTLSATESDALTAKVTAAAPDIVWVGLATPRQDGFVAEYAHRFAATLVPAGPAFGELADVKSPTETGLLRRHLLGNTMYFYGTLTDSWRARKLDRTPA